MSHVISTEAPVPSVEDRNRGEVEKSVKKRFLDSPFGLLSTGHLSVEMTTTVFSTEQYQVSTFYFLPFLCFV